MKSPPGANDDAVFDGMQSNASATFDTDVLVKAINQLVFQNNYTGTLTLKSDVLSLASGMLHRSNANIAGAGSIYLYGADSDWQNTGTLSLNLINLNANSSMKIEGDMTLSGTLLTNNGTLNWLSNTIKATGTGLILNRASSFFTMNPQGTGLLFDSDLNGSTINLAMLAGSTMNVQGGNDQINARFDMAGTANITDSNLEVSFASESSGTYNLSGLTSLTFSPPTTGTAITQFDAGAKILTVGNTQATAYIAQGVCTIAGDTVQIDRLYVQALAVLNGAGTLNVTTRFYLYGAIYVANTNLLANSTSELGFAMPGAGYVDIGDNFTNSGSLTWYGDVGIAVNARLANYGTWTTSTGGSPSFVDQSQGGGMGTFTNYGTFTVAGGSTPTVQIAFTNAGTFNDMGNIAFALDVVQSGGTLQLGTGMGDLSTAGRLLINGGQVQGWGTITTSGGVFNSGTIAAMGPLTINGDLTENANGTRSLVLEPALTGSMSNKIAISGKLKRNGTFQVTWRNGTPPNAAQSYSILTYGSIDNGSFTESDPAGTSIQYGATTATLFFSP